MSFTILSGTIFTHYVQFYLQLPEQWKTIFYNWQPQLWYALQQFAWIRRTEQKTKQVTFELQLMTPETANLTVKTPDAEAERASLALPITIERLPQSPQDIFNNLYGKKERNWSEFFLSFFFLALFTQKATNRQSTRCQIRFYSKGFDNLQREL